MTLKHYHGKRHFKLTPEPTGVSKTRKKKTKQHRFVVQKHAARHLHYDFRLEIQGVLKSWAVPKGTSLNPKIKRLAVQVEDHPLDYVDFEGSIPKGQYGGGEVIVWDEGAWECEGNPFESWKAGKIKFTLNGDKLHGKWMLIRTAYGAMDNKSNWLLIKEPDAFADYKTDILTARPESVKSGNLLDSDGSKKNVKKIRLIEAGAKIKKKNIKLLKWPEPELALLVDKVPVGSQWLYEIKFDGYRIIAEIKTGQVKLYTRHHHDWTQKFKSIAAALKKMKVESAVLDGEVVVLDKKGISNFQALQNILKKHSDKNLDYFIFDLLQLNGKNIAELPLIERKKILQELLEQNNLKQRIHFSDHIEGQKQGEAFYKKTCRIHLEGVMIKDKDKSYYFGRNDYWLKLKCIKRQEFVIGGFTEPEGSRVAFGALLLGYHDQQKKLHYAGKVGTGFDAATLRSLYGMLKKYTQSKSSFINPPMGFRAEKVTWIKPQLVAEIDFRGWTDENRLRQASFQGLRQDKSAMEVIREGTKKNKTMKKNTTTKSTVAGVLIKNPDKIFFPEINLTKLELAQYYHAVAKWMLPYIKDRPLNILRCPDGIEGECFRQKHLTHKLPAAIKKIMIKHKGSKMDGFLIHDVEGLINLIQLGSVEFHIWGELYSQQGFPDQIVFDLDPDSEVDWRQMIDAAFLLKDVLLDLKLISFVKTTGGKGLHVTIPIKPLYSWQQVRAFAQAVANTLVKINPKLFIATASKTKRKNKIFVDYFRNIEGATFVAPYSTRVHPSAPIAMPLTWNELKKTTASDDFTVMNTQQRWARLKKDPWHNFFHLKQIFTKELLKLTK